MKTKGVLRMVDGSDPLFHTCFER